MGQRPDSTFEKGENQNLLLALGFQFTTRPVCARLMNIDLLNWFNGLSRLFTTTLNALSRFPPTWNCCIWNRSSCALARATRDNLTKSATYSVSGFDPLHWVDLRRIKEDFTNSIKIQNFAKHEIRFSLKEDFPSTVIWYSPNITSLLRYAVKQKNDIIWEFFPTWGGGSSQIPKLL